MRHRFTGVHKQMQKYVKHSKNPSAPLSFHLPRIHHHHQEGNWSWSYYQGNPLLFSLSLQSSRQSHQASFFHPIVWTLLEGKHTLGAAAQAIPFPLDRSSLPKELPNPALQIWYCSGLYVLILFPLWGAHCIRKFPALSRKSILWTFKSSTLKLGVTHEVSPQSYCSLRDLSSLTRRLDSVIILTRGLNIPPSLYRKLEFRNIVN